MKLGTILAALTAAIIGTASVTALAQSTPPTPKPAAGALPNPNPNAVQKSFRTQNASEQKQTTASQTPRDVIPPGSSRQ